MTYRRFASSINEGNAAEKKFEEIIKKLGFTCKYLSDFKSQCHDHVDYSVEKDGKTALIDVKAMKRISRSDKKPSSSKIWLEFKNVNGKNGWLYGKANFIAFESDDGFHLVPRDKLLIWALNNIDFDNPADSTANAYKKAYSRNKKNDLISYVDFEDIKHLVHLSIS